MSFEQFILTYGGVIVAFATLFVTILYVSITRKISRAAERTLEAQQKILQEQHTMFDFDRTPYLIFEHKGFNVGYFIEPGTDLHRHRVDTYFINCSKVRIRYYFEKFELTCNGEVIEEMSGERQKRYRYILPQQERHHFCIMDDPTYMQHATEWFCFEYVMVYESFENAHPVRYKSRRKIKYKPTLYDRAELVYLRWHVLSEYDGPYDEDSEDDEIDIE